PVRVDLHRNDQRTVKYAGQALAPVEAHILPVIDLLAPSNPDRIFLGLNVKVLFVDPGQLDNGNKVVTLLEHIDQWIAACTGRGGPKPVAGKTILKSTLKRKQRFEGIRIPHNHDDSSISDMCGPSGRAAKDFGIWVFAVKVSSAAAINDRGTSGGRKHDLKADLGITGGAPGGACF